MHRKMCGSPFSLRDNLAVIQKERKRLEGLVTSEAFKKNPQWRWMLNWLAKTDEYHLKKFMSKSNGMEDIGDDSTPDEDYIETGYHCDLCFKPRQYLLETLFSFCDEYGCGLHICKECAGVIGKLAESMPEEEK